MSEMHFMISPEASRLPAVNVVEGIPLMANAGKTKKGRSQYHKIFIEINAKKYSDEVALHS